jgi:hypothetical protein
LTWQDAACESHGAGNRPSPALAFAAMAASYRACVITAIPLHISQEYFLNKISVLKSTITELRDYGVFLFLMEICERQLVTSVFFSACVSPLSS